METEYPSTEDLENIKNYEIKSEVDCINLLKFVKDLWWSADWGWKEDLEKQIYYISTGGWSGNEDLIDALQQNLFFWMLMFYSHRRGGHYIFCSINNINPEGENI